MFRIPYEPFDSFVVALKREHGIPFKDTIFTCLNGVMYKVVIAGFRCASGKEPSKSTNPRISSSHNPDKDVFSSTRAPGSTSRRSASAALITSSFNRVRAVTMHMIALCTVGTNPLKQAGRMTMKM